MRRALGVLSPLLALALALSVALASSVPRHVDPLTVGETLPNPVEVLRLYGSIASCLEELDVLSAMGNVSVVKAVYVPERLRAAIQRLNELLERYVLGVNETKAIVDLIAELVSRGDYNSSLARVPPAYASLAEAAVVYDSLSVALRDLSALGVPRSEVERIARSMGVPLELLRNLLDDLRRTAREALERAVETRLTVWVSEARVPYGGTVEVFGRLTTSSGEPLGGQVVEVRFGPRRASASTDPTGSFRAVFTADLYLREVPVFAEFTPRTRDLAYSRSNEVLVTVDFYTPRLELSLTNDTVVPGRSTFLTVSADADLEVVLRVPFASPERLRVRGEVAVEVRVPEWAPEGAYEIVAESVPRGYVGPARARAALRVVKLDPEVRVEAPGFAVAGLPLVIRVEPSVDSRIEAYAVPPLDLEIESGEVRARLPLSYLEPGVSMVIRVVPLDPAYRVRELSLSIPAYNPVSVAVPVAGAGAVLAAAAPRVWRSGARGPARRIREIAGESGGAPAEGSARRLFSELLGVLLALTGVFFEAHQTFREYLEAIRGRVSEAVRGVLGRYFARLEALLYGPPPGAGSREGLVADLLRDLVGWLRERLASR